MPAAIDPITKKQVISQYLNGVSRDRIAADNGVGTGTVSSWEAAVISSHPTENVLGVISMDLLVVLKLKST
jgi:hypothetical protein